MADIYFRTDGNKEIATGHIMRCLSIARTCQKKGASVTFLVSDSESLALLRERFLSDSEFNAHCLHTDYKKISQETDTLAIFLKKEQNDKKPWLFIDSYFVAPDYFRAVSRFCKTAYLDDLRSFDCDVDLIINYDTSEDCPYYENASVKLLGAQYTPLREQFQNVDYEIRPEAKNVLLSTGGTDPYGTAGKLLCAIYSPECRLEKLKKMHYHIPAAATNTQYPVLQRLSAENPHIHLHKNILDMASFMASCDLAVSAGGTTLYELCAVGVPTISLCLAENQKTAVKTFSETGNIPCAGDITSKNGQSELIDNVLYFLTHMSENIDLRRDKSRALRTFLDGSGADKIAKHLFP